MQGGSSYGRGGNNMYNSNGRGGRGGYDNSRGGFNGGQMSNYKTIKCKYYESGKNCPYQNKCSYAHGQEDLRQAYQ